MVADLVAHDMPRRSDGGDGDGRTMERERKYGGRMRNGSDKDE